MNLDDTVKSNKVPRAAAQAATNAGATEVGAAKKAEVDKQYQVEELGKAGNDLDLAEFLLDVDISDTLYDGLSNSPRPLPYS
ncbi:hypothetical protein EUX98_g1894 [Antrodiella citrinella]|uniref:Uncharacterized protein n=1 Tax=Antrodiella citrinella TaxID=2447956 RepID=A0A4S4N3C3_9APHY|nr:hypothetical protein EUX98_g1894 [Antrodiella citrinella]